MNDYKMALDFAEQRGEGIMELSAEEVENCVKNDSRAAVQLPFFINNEYAADKIPDVISGISKLIGDNEVEVIVSSPQALFHMRIEGGKYGKARACAAAIERLHHDIMPYTTVIVSVPKQAMEKLKEMCKRQGFLH